MKYLLSSCLFLVLCSVNLVYGPVDEPLCEYKSGPEERIFFISVFQEPVKLSNLDLGFDPNANEQQNEFYFLCAVANNCLMDTRYYRFPVYCNGNKIDFIQKKSDQKIIIEYFLMSTKACVLFNLGEASAIYYIKRYIEREGGKSDFLFSIAANLEVHLGIPRLIMPDQPLCFQYCVKVYNPSCDLQYSFFCVWGDLIFQILANIDPTTEFHITKLLVPSFSKHMGCNQFGLDCLARQVNPEDKIISEDQEIIVHCVLTCPKSQNMFIKRLVRAGENLLDIGNRIYQQIMSVRLRANSYNWKQVLESQFPIDSEWNLYPADQPQNALLNYLVSQEGYTLCYNKNKLQEWINGQFTMTISPDNMCINTKRTAATLNLLGHNDLFDKICSLPSKTICQQLLNLIVATEPDLFDDLVGDLLIWQIWEALKNKFDTYSQPQITSFYIRNVNEFTISMQGKYVKIIGPTCTLTFEVVMKSSKHNDINFIEKLTENPIGITTIMEYKRSEKYQSYSDAMYSCFGLDPEQYSFEHFIRIGT